jgi:hypothetical protein
MKNKIFILLSLLISFVMAAGLLSCGAGGSGGGDGPGTGSVAVLLTDAPTDDFSEINITIEKIELFSDDLHVTIFSANKSEDYLKVDLLDLKNETSLLTIGDNIPAITYHKIRLTVYELELVDNDGNVFSSRNNGDVKLPGNRKIDLNPRDSFSVTSGKMLVLQLDLDAEKSIHIVERNGKYEYNFRPVVFIDIIGDIEQGKLIRIKGIVRDIDRTLSTFKLCPDNNDVESYHSADINNDNSCCVTIYVYDDTSFFDISIHGNPVTFGDLTEESSATVIGTRNIDLSQNNSCSMGLDAIVVEIGDFLKLTGTIRSVVGDDDRFGFMVDPDQEYESPDPINVHIQPGTKIYSSTGNPLDANHIKPDERAEIDGKIINELIGPDTLNAAFISIIMDIAALEKLSGEIANIHYINKTFDLIKIAGTDCVEVGENTQIFRITESINSYTSQMIGFSELGNGNKVDLYGVEYNSESGCFLPKTIIAFEIATT